MLPPIGSVWVCPPSSSGLDQWFVEVSIDFSVTDGPPDPLPDEETETAKWCLEFYSRPHWSQVARAVPELSDCYYVVVHVD